MPLARRGSTDRCQLPRFAIVSMGSFPRSQRFEHYRIVRICPCRDVDITQIPTCAITEHPLQPFTIAWLPSVVTARCGVKAEILHRSGCSIVLTPLKRRVTTVIMSNNKDMQPGDTAAWNWGGSSIEGMYPWMSSVVLSQADRSTGTSWHVDAALFPIWTPCFIGQ